jgi:hypothetical protein
MSRGTLKQKNTKRICEICKIDKGLDSTCKVCGLTDEEARERVKKNQQNKGMTIGDYLKAKNQNLNKDN